LGFVHAKAFIAPRRKHPPILPYEFYPPFCHIGLLAHAAIQQMSQLPISSFLRSPLLRRPKYICSSCNHQIRHASLLKRPRRPYSFTQLVALSDGSTYLQRTTSPLPVYKSTKDTRNSPLWNPSSQKLLNVEADEAGRLRAFRARFGRGWDARTEADAVEGEKHGVLEDEGDWMGDLIAGYDGGEENKLKETEGDKVMRDSRKPGGYGNKKRSSEA
jgi:hypothetical protein